MEEDCRFHKANSKLNDALTSMPPCNNSLLNDIPFLKARVDVTRCSL